MKWQPNEITLLKILWSTSLTASAIAKTLGRTRSSVLGRIQRMELNNRDKSKSHPGRRPRISGITQGEIRRPSNRPIMDDRWLR